MSAIRGRGLRTRSSSLENRECKVPCPLYMECEEEPLSQAQKNTVKERKAQFLNQMSHLEKLCKGSSRMITDPNVPSATIRTTTTSTTINPEPVSDVVQPPQSNNIQRLLMDPRTGRILGAVNAPPNSGTVPTLAPTPTSTPRTIKPPNNNSSNNNNVANKGMRVAIPPLRQQQPQVVDLTRTSSAVVSSSSASSTTSSSATTSSTTSNNSTEKTKTLIPSLLVTPKPSRTITNLTSKRTELDMKVKNLLILPPTKFTEWLIQQGLVPTEQYEIVDGSKVKLKLGMYSDAKKFPYSGGYVWINETNQSKVISVYRGSLFQATNHAPTAILKLIYHWSCQTNNQNIVLWVKVDSNVIHQYFQLFRSVCTITVQEDVIAFGGANKTVQIGVISLGTTTGEGNKREVKVEVLGVLDLESGRIRLRATEPAHGITQSERFARIFEPLPMWVYKNSKIITDFSVDKDRLVMLGYLNVQQCSVNAKRPDTTNAAIMDYLKRTVPKMFQNNLSYLSTNQIQQFLDELTFREMYNYPLACFDCIVQKIAMITSSLTERNEALVPYLKKVQDNPFGDWRTTNTVSLAEQAPSPKPGLKRNLEFTPDIDRQITKKMKLTSELVNLESYYYGILQGDIQILSSEFKADMAFKCHLCRKVYMNNIEFMKHLCLHIESDRTHAVDLADLCQCKYCYKDFETPYAMQTHLEDLHLRKGFEFVCRICDEGFKVKNQLIYHMMKFHVRSELPYLCYVCGFRSSSHRDLVDHFQEVHDRTDKLQCPRCLKTYSLFGEKGYNSTVASSFITHIQTHQDKKTYSCRSCRLSFLQNDQLKNHVIRDHASFKDFENLEVYQYASNEEPIKLPKPDERSARTAARKSGLVKVQPQMAFAAQNLEDMLMYNVDREDCGECNKKLSNPGHFAAYLCCTKCRYSTCCSKAIAVHVNMFHGASKPVYSLGTPCLLDHDLFCVCGFKTNSGNKMAKHLGVHGCKSAYPSKEAAKSAIRVSASFAPLIAINEENVTKDPSVAMAEAYRKNQAGSSAEEKKVNEGGPLAFLGLQRKLSDDDDKKEQTSKTSSKKDEVEENFVESQVAKGKTGPRDSIDEMEHDEVRGEMEIMEEVSNESTKDEEMKEVTSTEEAMEQDSGEPENMDQD